jgi:hypothetical protein
MPEIRATLRLCHSSGGGRLTMAKGVGCARVVMSQSFEKDRIEGGKVGRGG